MKATLVGLLALFGSGPTQAQDTAGNPEAGRQVAGMCQNCHGLGGYTRSPSAPHIGGEPAACLAEQLRTYRSGEREHEMMSVIAKYLSDEQIAASCSRAARASSLRGNLKIMRSPTSTATESQLSARARRGSPSSLGNCVTITLRRMSNSASDMAQGQRRGAAVSFLGARQDRSPTQAEDPELEWLMGRDRRSCWTGRAR